MNYYEKGSPDDIWVSNSSLTAINPEQGGHPQKFMDFFKESEEKETKSLETGKLLHKYIENPDAFIISDVVEPTDMMMGLLKSFVNLIEQYKNNLITVDVTEETVKLTSKHKTESAQKAEIEELKLNFIVLAAKYDISLPVVISLFRIARHNSKAYTSYGEAKVVRDVVEGHIKYLDFLVSSKGKISLSLATKEQLDSMITSIYNNPTVKYYLGLEPPDELSNIKIYKELDLFWVEAIDGVQVQRKARLDVVIVDFDNQKILIPDAKTTAYSIYQFQTSFEKYEYYRQLAFYYQAVLNNLQRLIDSPSLGNWKIECFIVPIETQGYFLCGVYALSSDWLSVGIRRVTSLLYRVAYHMKSKNWSKSMEEVRNQNILSFHNPK